MFRVKMDLRSIVTYLSMKDMNAREIYADMNDTLGADWIGYSTVRKHLREISFSSRMLDKDFEPKIKEENFIDEAILRAFEECPFSSLRQTAKRTLIPMSTVRCHLVNFFGVSNQKHSMGSSLPLIEPKQAPVKMSQDLLQVLRLAKHHAWK
jgi:hypothetical protein